MKNGEIFMRYPLKVQEKKIIKLYWISVQKEAMEKISVLLLKMEFIHLRLNKCD